MQESAGIIKCNLRTGNTHGNSPIRKLAISRTKSKKSKYFEPFGDVCLSISSSFTTICSLYNMADSHPTSVAEILRSLTLNKVFLKNLLQAILSYHSLAVS